MAVQASPTTVARRLKSMNTGDTAATMWARNAEIAQEKEDEHVKVASLARKASSLKQQLEAARLRSGTDREFHLAATGASRCSCQRTHLC